MTEAKAALIKAHRKAEYEKYEAALWQALSAAGIRSRASRQYQCVPDRNYRFDIAFPHEKIACEINGGLFMKTAEGDARGHANPRSIIRDYEKANAAVVAGWRVLTFAPKHVESGEALVTILKALRLAR
jgi:very-short-patch-repair endonuclease